MEDANIMKTRKYLKGYDGSDIGTGLNREVIGDFTQAQTVVDYDTENFKYTDFNDPLYMYQDPLFAIFDVILDTEYSPLLSVRQGISSIQSFLSDYAVIPGIEVRQKVYNEFKTTLYKLFNTGFREIDRNKSYYINTISGLDKMTAKIVDFEKDKITMVLNDDISMITTYLAQLYNNLVYSYKDQRYMFPANLLRFNMYIKIHDVRNMINYHPKFKPYDSNDEENSLNESFDKSYQIYYLQDCTFDFFKSKTFDDSITVGGFEASVNNKASTVSLEITYKSISVESGFPLIKNNMTDKESSALTLQNKAFTLESFLNNNQVFLNNEKSVETFNDEIESLKSPSLNSNSQTEERAYNDTDINIIKKDIKDKDQQKIIKMGTFESGINGDVIVQTGSKPKWKSPNDSDTTFDSTQNHRLDTIEPTKGGRPYDGDVIVESGLEPKWKSPNDSDTTFEINQNYRIDRMSPESGGRPYEGDVQLLGPGALPRWFISETSAPELYAMKQSVLNQINLFGFIRTLPLSIINLFMGGYHGLRSEQYISGGEPNIIYGPRGAENYGGNAIPLPELEGEIIPNNMAISGLNRLEDQIASNYPENLLPDPNVLSGEIINVGPILDSQSLEGETIPGSIIVPGGTFSDPTVLNGENLNFQIPTPELFETLYIPIIWYLKDALQGSISTSWTPKDPLVGSIVTEYNVQPPLEGVIPMSFYVKDPLSGFIEMSFHPKDDMEGVIDTSIKNRIDLEGRISQDVNEREYLSLIKPIYDISVKSPLSHYIDTTSRIKPLFNRISLYTYPEFERNIELGSLYLNITEENIMPIVYLYSKVNEFKSLMDYYVYNRVISESKSPNTIIAQTIKDIEPLNLIYSYNNIIDIPRTMQNVFVYNNDVNKVNNMIVNYVFEKSSIKKEITEIQLYNNTIFPILMPEIYLHQTEEKDNYLSNDRLYQMQINEFGNNLPNGLSVDNSYKEKNNYLSNDRLYQMQINEFGNNLPKGLSVDNSYKEKADISLGSVFENNINKKEFTLPILYEPSKIKKLLDPIKLYEPIQWLENENKRVSNLKSDIKEVDLMKFDSRLEDIRIENDVILLKTFPYTTLSYKPLYEVEKEETRDQTLDNEKLDLTYSYRRPLFKEYIPIKPILDKDSELAIKLEGDRIDDDKRERYGKEGSKI